MFAKKALSEVADRKRLLIAQSDVHRALLRAEWVRARSRWEGMVATGEKLRSSPWLLVGGAVVGLVAARKWRSVLKILPVALTGWKWFKKMRSSARS